MNQERRFQVGSMIVALLFYVLAGFDKLSIDDPEYLIGMAIIVAVAVCVGAKREGEE